LQQQYEAEQQSIRKKHGEDLRKSQQLEEERRREVRGHSQHAPFYPAKCTMTVLLEK